MKLKGTYAAILTNTNLPLEGKVTTINAYCAKWHYTIKEVWYDGNNPIESMDAFNTHSTGAIFVIR